jgi:hypothetical protein
MNKLVENKKNLKLSETDRRVLLAYSNSITEAALKPALVPTADKDDIKLY